MEKCYVSTILKDLFIYVILGSILYSQFVTMTTLLPPEATLFFFLPAKYVRLRPWEIKCKYK